MNKRILFCRTESFKNINKNMVLIRCTLLYERFHLLGVELITKWEMQSSLQKRKQQNRYYCSASDPKFYTQLQICELFACNENASYFPNMLRCTTITLSKLLPSYWSSYNVKTSKSIRNIFGKLVTVLKIKETFAPKFGMFWKQF